METGPPLVRACRRPSAGAGTPMRLGHLLCVLPLIALACGDLPATAPAHMHDVNRVETSLDAVAMAHSASPDLQVGASVDDSSPETGGSITLSATVTNSGGGVSASTTLRYYQSSDSTITHSDSQVGTDTLGALAAARTSVQSVDLIAPSSAGTYYYGACADAVTGESDTANNCSAPIRVEVSVPLTATLANLPETHDGHSTFPFELRFSVEPSGLSYVTVRDALFDVTNGDITHARRATRGSNLAFVVTVQPSAYSDISLTVRGTTDCEAQHAVCTEDGRTLAGGPTETVAMTAQLVMGVADTEVEEADGATLDFPVTLSRAADREIEVRYRTYNSGHSNEATVGVDYEPVQSSFTFAPGETSKTISVTVLDDTEYEGTEIVKFWLSGVRRNAAQIADSYAVGTIRDYPDPDLEVEARVNDANPETGGSFTLSATVTNVGDGPAAAATTLRYYRSADTTIRPSDTEIGTDAVGSLAASGTSEQSVDLTAPSTAGVYYYGACVDTVNGESDTTDNCSASVEVAVVDPSPDLAVGSASVSDADPATGGSFTLSATVSNVGTGPSSATTLRYYRSVDTTITSSDTEVGTDAVGALAASGTSDQSVDLTAPSTAGVYYYGVCVDTVTGESTTANNCSASVRLNVVDPPPDLAVGSPSVSDADPATGGSFTLSATVSNEGGPSSATTLRYYRSADTTITSSDTEVGTDAVGALAASGTSDQSVDLTAPSTAGTYYYGACVDTVTGESTTANNCSASVRVDVSAPITATYAYLPPTHDGATPFWFELRFSEAPTGLSYVTVRDALFDVSNGHVTGARRATWGSNLAFVVTVQPSSAGDLSISVKETTNCEAQHAVCTDDGRMLAAGTGATVNSAQRPPIVDNPSGEKFDIDLIFTSNVDSAQRAVVEAVRDTLEAIVGSTELTDITMPAIVECDGVSVADIGVVDDIAIIFDISYIDGTSTRTDIAGNAFGWQLDCYRTTEHNFPVVSMIKLDQDDVRTLLTAEEFRELVLHELLHALGFSRTTFDLLGLVATGEYNRPYFIGESATEAFVAASGAQYESDRVPLLDQGSHWGFLLHKDLMGTLRGLYQRKLSAITLQALADMGYTVDLRFAEPFQLPRTSGDQAREKPSLDMGNDVRRGPVTVLDRYGTPVRVIQPPSDANQPWRFR